MGNVASIFGNDGLPQVSAVYSQGTVLWAPQSLELGEEDSKQITMQ